MRKELKSLLSDAEKRGWTWTKTKAGHIRLVHPCGAISFMASTPSENRALTNAESILRRLERNAAASR